MVFHRQSSSRLIIGSSYRPFTRSTLPRRALRPFAGSTRFLAYHSMEEHSELFEYTSGRWIWNDALKHSERRRVFNVSELKRLAAVAVNQEKEDVVSFRKLAEGGFNRTFLVTMRDGFQFVGRIPYPITEPKHLVIASEVATMDFLRSHGIPVPQIYGYSTTSENAAGTEYIFMELIQGTNLGDIWFDLSEKARLTVITEIVELESRLFALPFPASGSLYYTQDMKARYNKIDVPIADPARDSRFCIGPDTRLGLWHGKRLHLPEVDRGPYATSAAALMAGAKKEMAYLMKFGRPLHPFQRLRREIYDYQKQSPSDHIDNLGKYLRIAPYLVPDSDDALMRPTLRHPDLQPNNVFVSDELKITGLIDWQHCAILPLFLQCGIPNSLQNYGDSISESLVTPELPHHFEEMSESEQFEQVVLLRRRQLHYFYVAQTAKLNPMHYNALAYDFSILRRKLFDHASYPWEGDNVTLKADLIHLTKEWPNIIASKSTTSGNTRSCPISFREDEINECLRLNTAQIEADEQLQACRDVIGIGLEGWVPMENYDEIKQRETKLKSDALEAADSKEEQARLCEHWIFGDFDEEEYS